MASETAGPAHRVQSAMVEYGYPQGHLGHLTPHEEQTLREFKALVIEKGLYKPAAATDEFGTHDDALLLRFLRARRFHVQDALKQFKDTEDWRAANQIDILYETIDVDDYDATRVLYPQWTGRRDRRGIPVYIFEVKHLHAKAMAAYEKSAKTTQSKAKTDSKIPPKLLRLFALYENLIRFVMPLCSAMADRENSGTPITQSNNIVDISGVGLKQFWNLRAHMQDASQLATAHYPETLDRIFIIGAPAFFPTVWGWIKRWFDPITTSKIFILSAHDVHSTLRSFIEPANIPKKYGGELDFNFGDMPVLDPALEQVVEWRGPQKDFPHGPLFWVARGDKIDLKAVGSVNGKERSEYVCSVETKFKGHNLDAEETIPAATNAPEEKEDGVTVQEGGLQTSQIEAQGTSGEDATVIQDAAITDGSTAVPSESEGVVVESGEVVTATRPEPVSFVTATEDLNKLSLKQDEKTVETELNGVTSSPHVTITANLLDPAVSSQG
ncbi:MAG: hypothetical protein M1818_006125 [Claussenomyces sp. TS43310]|nr:MAG: hypothetical protein M1818_006125 [Claussenomyces sp. TS43310]